MRVRACWITNPCTSVDEYGAIVTKGGRARIVGECEFEPTPQREKKRGLNLGRGSEWPANEIYSCARSDSPIATIETYATSSDSKGGGGGFCPSLCVFNSGELAAAMQNSKNTTIQIRRRRPPRVLQVATTHRAE